MDKSELRDPIFKIPDIVHSDRLQKISAQPGVPNSILTEPAKTYFLPQPDAAMSVFPLHYYNRRPEFFPHFFMQEVSA